MHAAVREAQPAVPAVRMKLLPEGTRFGLLRHMLGSPLHLAVMVAAMLAVMAAAMMLLH